MYTNTEYDLSKELPKEIKLEVYKKAIDIIENDIENKKEAYYLVEHYNLCLLLPCILWNLNKHTDSPPNCFRWSFFDTKHAFTEIANYIKLIGNFIGNYKERNQYRLEILKLIVNQLENGN